MNRAHVTVSDTVSPVEIHVPALDTMSIPVLERLHRAVRAAGDTVENAGWASTDENAQRLLHAITECFTSLENDIVSEMASRVPTTKAERCDRMRVMLHDLMVCTSPEEIRDDIAELLGRL
jgi:hypothetical protein